MDLQEKSALVAGGGGGIGRAVALALGRAGAKVAVADIAKDNAEKVKCEVESSRRSCHGLRGGSDAKG